METRATEELGEQITKLIKGLLLGCAALLGFGILGLVGLFCFIKWQYHLPDENRARESFQKHRSEFVRLTELLKSDGHYEMVNSDKWYDLNGRSQPLDTERSALFRSIRAKFVLVREDGAIEFAMWGFGGAIMSDSYLGIRFQPKDYKETRAGWVPSVVKSLRPQDLPHKNGSVATGSYEEEIEPNWFIYRFEYQE